MYPNSIPVPTRMAAHVGGEGTPDWEDLTATELGIAAFAPGTTPEQRLAALDIAVEQFTAALYIGADDEAARYRAAHVTIGNALMQTAGVSVPYVRLHL